MQDLIAILPALSLLIAAGTFYFARKKETQETSTSAAKMVTQLETISRDVEEMRSDVKEMRREWHADHDKIVSMERDIKAMWKHIDRFNGKEEESSK